jgi:tight adherence protein C
MSAVLEAVLRWGALACAALSAALLGRWLWDHAQRRQAAARAQGAAALGGRTGLQELQVWSLEAWQRRLPPWLLSRLQGALQAQGHDPALAAVLSLRAVLLGLGAAALAWALGAGALSWLFLILGALPWLRLRDAAAMRRRSLLASLPEALDLLSACVQAGLGLDPALQRVSANLPAGPLRQELQRTLDELRLGRPRREAFLSLEARAAVRELGMVLRAVLRSEARGVPLAPVLLAQAQQMRRLRSLAVQKSAAQAPVKMLLPLMGFILPVVFLVVFGPILLRLSELGF